MASRRRASSSRTPEMIEIWCGIPGARASCTAPPPAPCRSPGPACPSLRIRASGSRPPRVAAGPGRVNTATRAESVLLTVENTGDKLTPQVVSTLTDPFERGTERIRGDHAAVGLGLAIVKSITQAHDGTLTLTPRAAGGLCVTVQLPAALPHTGR